MTQIKKLQKITICFLILIIVIVFKLDLSYETGAKTNSEIQREIDALNDKRSKIDKEQEALKNAISSGKSQVSDLSAEISYLYHEIDLIDEQIFVMDELINRFTLLTEQQTVQIAELEVQIDEQQKMLNDMIRMSYEYGGIGNMAEFIFSAEDFSDLITRIDMLAYHLSYNDKVIDNYSKSLSDLEKTKEEYEKSIESMSIYKAEQEILQADLETKQVEANLKKVQIEQDVAEYEKELATKKAFVDQLNNEIKELAQSFAKEDNTTYTGSFYFPLPLKYKSSITSYYGNRLDPFTNKTAYHDGYDFAAPKSTEIYAADSGTVVIAKWNGGYGNCVTINHGGGIMTLYGHCNSLNVVSGQKVNRGDVIAYVGTTGRSTGNHLHFSVYKNGSLTDPASYLGLN